MLRGSERSFARFVNVADGLAHAARSLRRASGVTAALVLAVALAAGGNLAIASVLDRLLFRGPTGVAAPNELRRLYLERHLWNGTPYVTEDFSYPDFRDFAHATYGLASVAAYARSDRQLRETGEWLGVTFADASLFSVLGIHAAMGRFFSADEASPLASGDVAVLSYQLWTTGFGADSGILGRRLDIDGRVVRVVGVAPRGFQGVDLQSTDVWLPLSATTAPGEAARWQNRDARFLNVLARVPAGSQTGLRSIDERLTATFRVGHLTDIPLDPRAAVVSGPLSRARGPGELLPLDARALSLVSRLTGISLIVLLVATGNCASVLLLRAVRRRREVQIRFAIGLSRERLAIELAWELVLIAVAAGIGAGLIGSWGSRLLQVMLLPATRGEPLGIGYRGLAAASAFAFTAVVFAGIGPALFLSRLTPGDVLKEGRSSQPRSRVRAFVIVGQSAMSVLLISIAATFLVSARRATAGRLGFDEDHLVTIVTGLLDRRALANSLSNALSTSFVAGVSNATSELAAGSAMTRAASSASPADSSGLISYNAVDTNYFGTLGIQLVRGRRFTAEDGSGGEPVAIVTEATAAMLWKNADAIGRCILAFGACRRVVGVVRDVRWDLTRGPVAHFYIPIAQSPRQFGRVVYVRTIAPATPANVVQLERALGATGIAAGAPRIYRLADRLEMQIHPLRGASGLLLGYALLILCSVCAGIYGKLSFDASQRMRELGVRSALGATPTDLAALLLGSGLRLLGGGMALGIAAVFASSKLTSKFLFDTSGSDPLIIGAVAAILFLAGMSAMFVASRRATVIDPAAALRSE